MTLFIYAHMTVEWPRLINKLHFLCVCMCVFSMGVPSSVLPTHAGTKEDCTPPLSSLHNSNWLHATWRRQPKDHCLVAEALRRVGRVTQNNTRSITLLNHTSNLPLINFSCVSDTQCHTGRKKYCTHRYISICFVIQLSGHIHIKRPSLCCFSFSITHYVLSILPKHAVGFLIFDCLFSLFK